jgi:hypothetical protein
LSAEAEVLGPPVHILHLLIRSPGRSMPCWKLPGSAA